MSRNEILTSIKGHNCYKLGKIDDVNSKANAKLCQISMICSQDSVNKILMSLKSPNSMRNKLMKIDV